jgi:hypothetical protein
MSGKNRRFDSDLWYRANQGMATSDPTSHPACVGMISGSAVANVATIGVFTIPLMKKAGYKPYFAAAVEAVSSTGGAIMPPIMGAAAFIMATFLGIPYSKVALAAAIPAIFYYVAVFIQVDLRAARENLKGIPKEELPRFLWVILLVRPHARGAPSNHEHGFLFSSPFERLCRNCKPRGRINPAPRRVQDKALNLTWFRGWG